jgi:hypothetical protein
MEFRLVRAKDNEVFKVYGAFNGGEFYVMSRYNRKTVKCGQIVD